MPRGKKKWSLHDISQLYRLYPTADIQVVLEALKHRYSWDAIRIKASQLGIRRIGRGGSKGESKYAKLAYCISPNHPAKESRWVNREDVKNSRCPKCGGRVRLPGPLSYRRKKK